MQAITSLFLLAGLVLAAVSTCAAPVTQPIDDFASLDGWTSNEDGGMIAITGAEGPDGLPAMRLRYTAGAHLWGNAVRQITLHANATAIQFRARIQNATSHHGVFVWVFEADGDGYLSEVRFNGKPIGSAARDAWHLCTVSLTNLRFEPRGNRQRQLLTADRLMIGMNTNDPLLTGSVGGGDAVLDIADLRFVLRAPVAITAAGPAELHPGARGTVAILEDRFPAHPAHAQPRQLGQILQRAGYGVGYLKAEHLADPSILRPDRFRVLILPYGAYYPSGAEETIRGYLSGGGCLLTTGGYAFDTPCSRGSDGAMLPGVTEGPTAEEIDAGQQIVPMNTRHGVPGDTMGLNDRQIGMFDPSYHLLYVTSATHPGPFSVMAPFSPVKEAFEGYAASSMPGSGGPVFPKTWARHIPLIRTEDALGRYRGDLGALLYWFNGPYKGSAWAFFGVTNTDVFHPQRPWLTQLPRLVDALIGRVFSAPIRAQWSLLKPGERIQTSGEICNLGPKAASVTVLDVAVTREGRVIHRAGPVHLTLKAGERRTHTFTASAPADTDLVFLRRTIRMNGRDIDRAESAVVIHQQKVIQAGLPFTLKDGFVQSRRPALLVGANHTGAMLNPHEDPLVWERDLKQMKAHGMDMLRILHVSPFMADRPTSRSTTPMDLGVEQLPEHFTRRLDALVQMCQRHQVVLFLTLHDWMDITLTDAELQAQRQYARLVTERYKDAPGVLIDIQNEPHIELPAAANPNQPAHVTGLWNQWLAGQYQDDDTLKAAWPLSPPEAPLGSIPWHTGERRPDNQRALDAEVFRTALLNRWIDPNAAGCREGDPERPVTVGFLQSYWAVFKPDCTEQLDVANFHSYEQLNTYRGDVRLFEQRYLGKSISLGEFGAYPDHQKRQQGQDNPTQDTGWYLQRLHYLFGSGGSFALSWCWKDIDETVFPWGLRFRNDGPPKDLLRAYRNMALLARPVQPANNTPAVWLVYPREAMLRAQGNRFIDLTYRWFDRLMEMGVPFATISDAHLNRLPTDAKLLIYPAPYHISDETFGLLQRFVSHGGALLATGDVVRNSRTEPVQTDRLQWLGLEMTVAPGMELPVLNDTTPLLSVRSISAEQSGAVWVNRQGAGQTWFSSAALLPADDLQRLLAQTGQMPDWSTDGAHIMPIREATGVTAFWIVNPGQHPAAVRIPTAKGVLSTTLEPKGVGLVRLAADGAILTVESQSDVLIGDTPLMRVQGHAALQSLDGVCLTRARSAALIPFSTGRYEWLNAPEGASVESGEFTHIEWRTLTQSSSRVISCSPADAFDIRLIAHPSRMLETRQALQAVWTLAPNRKD